MIEFRNRNLQNYMLVYFLHNIVCRIHMEHIHYSYKDNDLNYYKLGHSDTKTLFFSFLNSITGPYTGIHRASNKVNKTKCMRRLYSVLDRTSSYVLLSIMYMQWFVLSTHHQSLAGELCTKYKGAKQRKRRPEP
mgnify:CR=1 FL=1